MNFNRPYISQNFTEFWRRWHISLSRWMRDYLYISLGGNRGSAIRTYMNLWLVFLFSGFWHGANWTFVVWGLYHGFFLVLDKLFWLETSKKLGRFLNTILTFVFVLFGWVLFRNDTFSQASMYLTRMLDPVHYWSAQKYTAPGWIICNSAWFVFILSAFICFVPAFPGAAEKIYSVFAEIKNEKLKVSLRFLSAFSCLLLSILALSVTNYTPFIYFKF